MNNKMTHICKECGNSYCMECSDHESWENFCCEKCEKEYQKEKEFTEESK